MKNLRLLQGRDGGFALVIVLAIVVLLAILVVGFLSKAGSETVSVANYSAVNSAQQLVDTTVNLVQAQINEATTRGTDKAWASQPGAIRVFDNTGDLDAIYRLYSAESLQAQASSDLNADVPPSTWAQSPAVWVDLNAPAKAKDASNNEYTSYPILDPRSPTTSIEGFQLLNPPGATSDQPAPMPVRWLYVLQNGEIVPPAGTGEAVTIAGASKDNPIIGRVAYWTDDDTSKVNINTASVGSFWDVPRFDSNDERALADYQPAGREYQRYPGHPATTTLAKVLPSLSVDDLYAITPRYQNLGSQGGTVLATSMVPDSKSDRLYPSVGELLLKEDRGAQGLSRQQIESAQFFLTARSRAPEINLFGQPRISIWPIHTASDPLHQTANDRLMAFAGSVAGQPYYFSRNNPTSATADISLTRNQELLNYLDRLTDREFPGFGGSLNAKYGNDDKRQILTEVFDYIRTTNLKDTSGPGNFLPYADPNITMRSEAGEGQVTPSYHAGWNTSGFGRFYKVIEASVIFVAVGEGKNTTTSTNATPVVSTQRNAYTPNYVGGTPAGTPPDDTRAVQAFFVLSFFDPSHGWSGISHSFTVEVEGLQAFLLAGQPMNMPAQAAEFLGGPDPSSYLNYRRYVGSRAFGGMMDFRVMLGARRLGSDPSTKFPFYSHIIDVPLNPPAPLQPETMSFAGGQIKIRLYSGNSVAATDLVQEYTIDFPAATLPIPLLSDYRVLGTAAAINPGTDRPDRFDSVTGSTSRRRMVDTTGSASTSKDVVLSVVPGPSTGDYRLLASRNVPLSMFQIHPAANPATKLAYGFTQADGNSLRGAALGSLVAGATYVAAKPPMVPAGVTEATTTTGARGDWDTGLPFAMDGPYINKPDEGNIINQSTATPYFDSPNEDQPVGETFFSPNRQAISPVIFGSLPTGVKALKPWQTLLFRPGPGNHPGEENQPSAGHLADHLLLDLFWMPVVEPYAISEPFSTAGKVNLNYQIAPFSYITRNTALRSVLADVKVAKVSINLPKGSAQVPGPLRLPLNLSDTNGTLRQFKEKFDGGDIFRSATEICDIYLVPQGESWASNAAARTAWYGNDYAMVGDNVRERPYAEIYPRITTQSNTYTVHYQVQVLKNPINVPQGSWNEKTGKILSEYRGSTTLERYVDPNDPKLLTSDYNFTSNPNAKSLETLYRWRTVNSHQFAP